MVEKIGSHCLPLVLFSLISSLCCGQTDPSAAPELDLKDSGKRIENIISLRLPEKKVKALHSVRGRKMDFNANGVTINGDTLKLKKLRTHGQSTLMFKRKSFQIKLTSKATFRHGEREASLKKFYLLNLCMDKYYCHNRLAFEWMDSVGLFGLFYSYGELQINGNSEGIYMIIERPEDWAFREKESPLVLRRGPGHSIDKIKTNNFGKQGDANTYVKMYRSIYIALERYSGRDLFEALSESLDLDNYMQWMAFNFIMHNGDYADEVFFYVDPAIRKFRIIPWDYDDILAASPHEGLTMRNQTMGEKLIFSGEDRLDEKIGADPYLYKKYLDKLMEVLESMSPDLIKRVTEGTFAELYPYYAHSEILDNVQYDYYKDASLDHLRNYLSQIYWMLLYFRKIYMDQASESMVPSAPTVP